MRSLQWYKRGAAYKQKGEGWVKSGEEFRELFTSPNALFIGICEGWVKSIP